MRIKINKPGVIKLEYIFELLICVFYTWYFLPVSQALLWNYKTIFFGLFLVGTVALAIINGLRIHKIVIPILAYMLILTVLSLLKVDDADAHIRVSFTFWGTALLYFCVLKDEGRMRIGKYLLFLLVVTAVTSAIGVTTDNEAARTISHAASEEELRMDYKLKNISGVFLFQGLIFFVPLLVCLPQKTWTKVACWAVLVIIFLVLVNASFTISLIGFLFALILSMTLKEEKLTAKKVVGLLIVPGLIVILLLNGSDILQFLGDSIENEKIATRIIELRQMIYFKNAQGDVASRVEAYTMSLKTFLHNPFGVGAHYSYVVGSNGLGYHSKILDDLARFGFVALAFYVAFFVSYYHHLKKVWMQAGYSRIAVVIVLTWILLLFLNLGFRTADESIIMLFIMPVIPLLLRSQKNLKEGL